MQRAVFGVAILSVAVLAGGCAAGRQQSPAFWQQSETIEFGFDPVSEACEWRVGDRGVFEISTFDGKDECRFYVGCTVAPRPDNENWPAGLPWGEWHALGVEPRPGQAAAKDEYVWISWNSIYVALDRRDADFRVLDSTDYVLPMQLFERGSFDALQRLRGMEPGDVAGMSEAQRRELVESSGVVLLTLLAYEEMLRRPGIKDAAETVVRKGIAPNPLLLLVTRKFLLHSDLPDMIVDPDIEACALPEGFRDAASYEATCGVETLFDTHLICKAKITVVPPLPPFHISGGVVLVEGTPIGESKRWFKIRLVSARRGSGPVVPNK